MSAARLELVELYAEGDRIVARCTECVGRLSREASSDRPWNLWDLCDALGDHVRVNHPIGEPVA